MKQTYNTQGAEAEEIKKPINQADNNSLLDVEARKDTNIKKKSDPEGKKRIEGMSMEVPDEGGGADSGNTGTNEGVDIGSK